MAYKRNAPTAKRHFKAPLIILAVALLAVGAVAALELTDTTHIFHARKPIYNSPTAAPATKGIPSGDQTSGNTNDNSSDTSTQDTDAKHPAPDTSSNTPLAEPNGNFVSHHRPTLKQQMESICNTTAGATCQVSFTKDGVTKSLPTQTTDAGGATYWAWKPADISLTPGSWAITVKAVLGSQTATAVDALNLEVSP